MALDDEFRKQGEWLFRWRSFLPIILIPLIAVAIEGDATADVDAGWAIARHADGVQDGGQFGVAGNPCAS